MKQKLETSVNPLNKSPFGVVHQPSKQIDEIDFHLELIKIIKRYEACHGWTLLIAPDHLPNKSVLKSCSVNLDKVLIVHKKHCQDVKLVANQALHHDNCSAVVICNDLIDAQDIEKLRAKAHSQATALYLLPS